MKNLILPALLFISGANWGQITYRPIPETNAVWIQTELFTGGFHEY